MKLLSCHISNFGGLHNYQMDFDEGLNVILHDNGWGKTTLAAFLKAMLYGLDSKRSKNLNENERKKYLPWQGGQYGGTLDLEAGGKHYRITRTFGETARSDTARIIDVEKNISAKIDTENIGEYFFNLDSNAFQRSVFVNPNAVGVDGSGSIHTRLNAMVSQANDLDAFDDAIKKLTQQMKVYEKTGQRGLIGDFTKAINEKEINRDRLESVINEQDISRERISQIDSELIRINRDIDERKKKIEELSGESTRRETSQKMADDLKSQTADIMTQIDEIAAYMGGEIPEEKEVNDAINIQKEIESLEKQLTELEESNNTKIKELNTIYERYNSNMPTNEELDSLQKAYGELEGIKSTGAETAVIEKPDCYEAFSSALELDKDYLTKLQEVVDSASKIQEIKSRIESLTINLEHEEKSWQNIKAQYARSKETVEKLETELKSQNSYAPETVNASIEMLEDLQNKESIIKLREKEIADFCIAEEDRIILDKYKNEAPEDREAKSVLDMLRENTSLAAINDGLESRRSGEKAREESLIALLEQINSDIAGLDTVEMPGKPTSGVLKIIGLLMTVAGAGLGIIASPVLAVIALIGIILLVLGIRSDKKYNSKLEAYENNKSKLDALNEKKSETEKKLSDLKIKIQEIDSEFENNKSRINNNTENIFAWTNKWLHQNVDEVKENDIVAIIDEIDRYNRIISNEKDISEKKEFVAESKADIESNKRNLDEKYPEINSISVSESLAFLRNKATEYTVLKNQCQSEKDKLDRFLIDNNVNDEDISCEESRLAKIYKEKRESFSNELGTAIASDNEILNALSIIVSENDYDSVIKKVQDMMIEFSAYTEKIVEKNNREANREKQIESQKQQIDSLVGILSGQYPDCDMLQRIANVRADINTADSINSALLLNKNKLNTLDSEITKKKFLLNSFIENYSDENSEELLSLDVIAEKAYQARDLDKAKRQLLDQIDAIQQELKKSEDSGIEVSQDEKRLREELTTIESKRDALLMEYQEKGDSIRQADKALEAYPIIVSEIKSLYHNKNAAQAKLSTIKKTINLIQQAKENLAGRYLNRVEQLFNNYMEVWINDEKIKGVLDIDFNIKIEEGNDTHQLEGYSTGYCDMLEFCMRLALIDTLYEKEQPFLILDDPFVNLDTERLEKALELLNLMASNKQIIYFICHPIRAIDANADDETKARFTKLAEETRKILAERKATSATVKKVKKVQPRELYKTVMQAGGVPIRPVDSNYVITNNIFAMKFAAVNTYGVKDGMYELFFIDEIGHVLNERQIIEIKEGQLSTDKLMFNLNTRDDSGTKYELIIRESTQEEYEVIARIPFKANITFTNFTDFDV